MSLIGAFLAFYLVINTTLNKVFNPDYQIKRMEKMINKQEKRFYDLEKNLFEKPIISYSTPSIVNLVKEDDEYKVVIDLKSLDNDEKNVDVDFKDNILTIKGQLDKKERHKEEIINFSQSFYLDENILKDKITKEKKGNKYIVTIPFQD